MGIPWNNESALVGGRPEPWAPGLALSGNRFGAGSAHEQGNQNDDGDRNPEEKQEQ
jgi:hypothetical protein